jgi:hypothetical protein
MKSHQPEVFGTTLEKTNRWVKEISDLLHWDDHHKAYHGLRAVKVLLAFLCSTLTLLAAPRRIDSRGLLYSTLIGARSAILPGPERSQSG